ncbi:hypothetical protein MMYC01_209784 [Madurella mycetomatis]|uniref:Uncharacterized protein n=1 Tax=Madurella mycetomatis TaxID=100816 RepID=A0A175VSU1_9PEZI|nr:hypothetical protein MMYC01_209784 [Madurella mycetomatis]
MFGFTVPFKALRRRQYAVVLSSSIPVMVTTIITVMAGGIGGVAGLICESDFLVHGSVLNLFRQLPSFTHSKAVRSELAGVRFKLQHVPVVLPDGSITTLVYQLTTTVDPGYAVPHWLEDRALSGNRKDARGFWLTKRAVFLAEVIIWLGQAAITGALYQAARVGGKLLGDDGAGDSASAKQTIAKVVFTLTITVGGIMWQSIQCELQTFEPWQHLRKPRQRLYEALVRSDVSGSGLLTSTVLAVSRFSIVATWAAFSVFTIYVARVFITPILELAYAAGFISSSPFPIKTFGVMSGTPALGLAVTGVAAHLVILCNMFFVMLSGRTNPFLPRRPTTLAS